MQDVIATVTGNVGTDVELTHGEGWARASFRMACTPRIMRQGNWMDAETTWISVTTWGRTAHHVKASLAKGDPVVVQGKMRTSAWLRDGIRHERLVLEAATIGHDLTRGTSSFTRAGTKVRTEDGDLVDTMTGEVDAPEFYGAGPATDDQAAPDLEQPTPVGDPAADERVGELVGAAPAQ